jgi:hypothetical protein
VSHPPPPLHHHHQHCTRRVHNSTMSSEARACRAGSETLSSESHNHDTTSVDQTGNQAAPAFAAKQLLLGPVFCRKVAQATPRPFRLSHGNSPLLAEHSLGQSAEPPSLQCDISQAIQQCTHLPAPATQQLGGRVAGRSKAHRAQAL